MKITTKRFAVWLMFQRGNTNTHTWRNNISNRHFTLSNFLRYKSGLYTKLFTSRSSIKIAIAIPFGVMFPLCMKQKLKL